MNIKYLKTLLSRTRLSIFLIFLSSGLSLNAQTISLSVENEPLNSILVQLRDLHDLRFSFDDELLSGYQITVSKDFTNADKAVAFLIKGLPLILEKTDGVYLIYPKTKLKVSPLVRKSILQGVIKDALSGETLPYSHITMNSMGLIADGQGRFAFSSRGDSVFRIRASYLGYYLLDTTLTRDGEHELSMQPSVVGIKEIVVTDRPLKLSTMSNLNSGEMRLNHQVGSYLPGFADNALYNLLRLQPGVLAAGEQSNDLIIWGSYSGQTAVLFDGFTLFGLKNYNDNIGIVNPYMVKDVKLLKGAYPANYGGKAGGIVDITGSSGNRNKPELILSATNQTLNSKLSVPVTSRSAISLAFRQTYYNLYKNDTLNVATSDRMHRRDLVDLLVTPDYMFRDFTAKFAGVTKSGDSYYLDFLRGTDRFNYLITFNTAYQNVDNLANETNSQTGSSLFYGKVWDNGNTTDITLSYSDLSHHLLNQTNFVTNSMHSVMWRYEDIYNGISKIKARVDHQMLINQSHTLEMGGGILRYNITLTEDTIGQRLFTEENSALAIEGFVQDRISFKNGLNLLAGLRIDAPLYLGRALIQPRLSMNYELFPDLWFKAAWGKYDQYVVQSSVLDEAGNYRYFWTLSNEEDVPLQTAQHFSAGFNYQGSIFNLGIEGYYKKLDGLTRYIYRPNRIDRDVYTGDGFSSGVDLLIGTKYKKHTAWVTYTLSQTMERFSYFQNFVYHRAPQDQRHEVKLAVLLNFHPFYISTNYVYGSGFLDRSIQQFQRETTNLPYSRWDISGVYRLSLKKLDLNMGLSILNVLNTENIKLQNFVKIPDLPGRGSKSVNILAEAVPFTPTLFLLVKF